MAHIHHIVEGNLSGDEKTLQHSSLFLLFICCSRVDLQVVLSNREKKLYLLGIQLFLYVPNLTGQSSTNHTSK